MSSRLWSVRELCKLGSMRARVIGIHQLHARLCECLHEVKKGATIIATKRGRRVLRIVPEAVSQGDRLRALRNAGAILWVGDWGDKPGGSPSRNAIRGRHRRRQPRITLLFGHK